MKDDLLGVADDLLEEDLEEVRLELRLGVADLVEDLLLVLLLEEDVAALLVVVDLTSLTLDDVLVLPVVLDLLTVFLDTEFTVVGVTLLNLTFGLNGGQ